MDDGRYRGSGRLFVLYPEALAGRWSYADSRPVKLPSGKMVDDTGFITSLVDRFVADRIVDRTRVYAAGASKGGLMAWTLACAASDRFAAVAPMITGMIEGQAEQCHPPRQVPFVVIAGTDDWIQPYDGVITPEFRLMSLPETLEFWRKARGYASLKLTEIPRHEPADPTAAVLVEWTQCRDASPMRFLRIEGGGHSLPSFMPLSSEGRKQHGGRSQTIETAEELWKFFYSFSF